MKYISACDRSGDGVLLVEQATLKKQKLPLFLGAVFAGPDAGEAKKESLRLGAWFQKDFAPGMASRLPGFFATAGKTAKVFTELASAFPLPGFSSASPGPELTSSSPSSDPALASSGSDFALVSPGPERVITSSSPEQASPMRYAGILAAGDRAYLFSRGTDVLLCQFQSIFGKERCVRIPGDEPEFEGFFFMQEDTQLLLLPRTVMDAHGEEAVTECLSRGAYRADAQHLSQLEDEMHRHLCELGGPSVMLRVR